MPEHIKSAPNSKEFQNYLNGFVKKKERAHRRKVVKEVVASALLMIAG